MFNFKADYHPAMLAVSFAALQSMGNAYPDSLLQPIGETLAATPGGMAYLDDHHINCVVGRAKGPAEPYPPLYFTLTHSPAWTLAYFGNDGPLWIRKMRAVRQ